MKREEWQCFQKTLYFFAFSWLEASHVLNNFSINQGKNTFDDTVILFWVASSSFIKINHFLICIYFYFYSDIFLV